MSNIYIIDGNAYIHRAYHALPPLTGPAGQQVNAVYGFVRMLMKVQKQKHPDHWCVCFDFPAKNFRHELYPAYKAHRKAIDDELRSQMPLARRAAEALNIPIIEKEGLEADDIIAAIARDAAGAGVQVVIVSGDKDVLQLVKPGIEVWNESKGTTIDTEAVQAKYGLLPGQLPDMFALMGDTSDNVPGVKGIGPKTAQTLIAKYGSIEGVLSNVDNITGQVKEKLKAEAQNALLSKKLVIFDPDQAPHLDWKECRYQPPVEAVINAFFDEMGFISLKQGKTGEAEAQTAFSETPVKPLTIIPLPEVRQITSLIELRKAVASIVDTLFLEPGYAESGSINSYSFAAGSGPVYFCPINAGGHDLLSAPAFEGKIDPAAEFLGNGNICLVVHDIKKLLLASGIDPSAIKCRINDTMLAAYCIDAAVDTSTPESIAKTLVAKAVNTGADTELPEEAVAGAKAVECQRLLLEKFDEKLIGGLRKLYDDIELPVAFILTRMERTGIRVDLNYLTGLQNQFGQLLGTLCAEITTSAGVEFNINSPKQLGVILFEKIGLAGGVKTKSGGYSTNEEVLNSLAAAHPLPALILRHRELQKLKSTYIDALIPAADGNSRVHTRFNQAITATGRLSSSNPNLQNIPIRSTEGMKIRAAFAAAPGTVLLSADYSQIDLRALAHLCKDPALVRAFKGGEDIHTATAAEIFMADPSSIDDGQRRIAKTINFGIVYGISAFGLAQQLGIDNSQAKAYIESYFQRYPRIRAWQEELLSAARRDGFVTTLFGRVRSIPGINAKNGMIRSSAERMAINMPVQGTSADIIKIAMIAVDTQLTRNKLKTKMLLQVHDELVFETPENEVDAACALIKECMEHAVKLDVPLEVQLDKGMNWSQMGSWSEQ